MGFVTIKMLVKERIFCRFRTEPPSSPGKRREDTINENNQDFYGNYPDATTNPLPDSYVMLPVTPEKKTWVHYSPIYQGESDHRERIDDDSSDLMIPMIDDDSSD
jgi:hypothetical protein